MKQQSTKRIISLFVGLFFSTGVAMGQTNLPAYHTTTLENGLEVVVIPLAKTGVITTDIFYKVGSRNEVMGKSGIAHMLEHLNFKSTKNLKAGEFDEVVKGFGGVNNASTSFDYTHYYIKSSSQNLSKSLGLFAELMENLNLRDDEFQPERQVVAEERRWRTDNSPMGYLYFRLFNTAFVYHPYHWTPIGFMEDIQTWTIDDIKNFHATYYQPKNAVIVVAGDISADEVFKTAKEKFGKIKNTHDVPAVVKAEPAQDGPRRAVVYKETQTEILAIAYKIPPFDHEDQTAIGALCELLSTGKSSRLYETLVEKKQLANGLHVYNADQIDQGLLIILAMANPGVKAEEIEVEIHKELDKLIKKGIRPDELEKLKLNAKSDFIFALESSSSVADLYGSFLVRGNMAPLMNYMDNLNKLDNEKLKAVAKKTFDPAQSTTILLRKGQN